MTTTRHGRVAGRRPPVGLAVVLLLASCGGPIQTAPSSPGADTLPATPSSPTATAPPGPTSGSGTQQSDAPSATAHRIVVGTINGRRVLADRLTGHQFVPRGTNLIRLAQGRHSTLDPTFYDAGRIDETFARLAADGYNTVRVFLDTYAGGLPGDEDGLSAAYLDDVVDMLRRAKSHGIVVIFTMDWLPDGPAWAFSSDPKIEDVNSLYLSTGGVEADARFFRTFSAALVRRSAPLDALLAYELRNELYLTSRHPPFSLRTGSVTTANGRTYNLGDAGQRRTMLEDNVVAWVDRMRTEIRRVDPTALVTTGFFQPQGPNPSRIGDDRIIETRDVIRRSSLDFIDLHAYPGGELNLHDIVENFAVPSQPLKPIILGEFGAEHAAYPQSSDAVAALVHWQIESCAYGFAGWLNWTWDTTEQPEFWNAREDDGAIEEALAPITRPDPCAAGRVELPTDLAAGARATASHSIAGSGPGKAVDGLPTTIWNAGAGPVEWLQLDLRGTHRVDEIRLSVAQEPSGLTTHRVLVRGATGAWRVIATLRGMTSDGQVLVVHPSTALRGVRFVRIETTRSPSWVAWREVSVLGG